MDLEFMPLHRDQETPYSATSRSFLKQSGRAHSTRLDLEHSKTALHISSAGRTAQANQAKKIDHSRTPEVTQAMVAQI